MNNCIRTYLACGTAIIEIIYPACAEAKTDAPVADKVIAADAVQDKAQADSSDDGSRVGDIIVTAQRRSENIQSVPLAVSAFDQKALTRLGVDDTLEISKYVPSMVSQHNIGLASANTYYLRGLGNTQSVPTFDAPVGTYVDDVYIARQNANNYSFFDVDHVEILRGPQGTLFGKNTTGGAVSVIMKKPGDEFGGHVEATGGSYGRFTLKGAVDVPVNDKVLTKLAAFYVRDDGWLKNVTTGEKLNGGEDWGVRGDVRFIPTDRLTIDLSAEYTRNTDTYYGVSTLAVPSEAYRATVTPVFYETKTAMRQGSCDGDAPALLLSTGKGMCNLSKNYAMTGTINYDTGSGNITYIGSYRHLDQSYINEYNANSTNLYSGFQLADNGTNWQTTHEVKWNTSPVEGLRLVMGAFYMFEDNRDKSVSFSGGTTAFNPISGYKFHQTIETFAVYAQGDLDITSKLTATVGGRFTYEKKKIDFFQVPDFTGLGYTSAQVTAAGIPLSKTEGRVTPKFALTYKFTPLISVYASATNGFKSGGWNGNSTVATRVLPFDPETTWSFESGLRSELFDRHLRFNMTGFYARTKNLQATSGVIPPGETTIVSLARNAGTLRVYGVEIESQAVLTKELSLFANASLESSKYLTTVVTPGIPDNLQVLPTTIPVRVPALTLSAGINYMKAVEAIDGSVGGSFVWRHNSPYWVATLNTLRAPEENFLDATVRYENAGGKWGISAGISNLTDQKTVTANFLSIFTGEPRRFTARAYLKF